LSSTSPVEQTIATTKKIDSVIFERHKSMKKKQTQHYSSTEYHGRKGNQKKTQKDEIAKKTTPYQRKTPKPDITPTRDKLQTP